MKRFLFMILLLIMLLTFHDAVITGTQNGLLLWYQTLIPSLLPFILVTNAMSETNAYYAIVKHFHNKSSNKIYEIIAILLGNLCGYPIGGKIINDFVQNQCITTGQSNRILALSSQASPMFLIGYVYNHIFNQVMPLPIFLLCIYLPVFIYYCITVLFKSEENTSTKCMFSRQVNIKDTFLHAVETMVMIGLYVIIFSILLAMLLPLFHNTFPKLALSFLEITTGLSVLNALSIQEPLKTALLCALCSFGGICSVFQVMGVLDYHDKKTKKYLLDKFILSTGTFFMTYCYFIFN